MRNVNRSWPEQHGLTPVRERRNIGSKRGDHFGNAVDCTELQVGNFKRKFRDGKTVDRSLDVVSELVCRADKPVQQLRLCKIGNYVWRAATFDRSHIQCGRTDFGIVGEWHS